MDIREVSKYANELIKEKTLRGEANKHKRRIKLKEQLERLSSFDETEKDIYVVLTIIELLKNLGSHKEMGKYIDMASEKLDELKRELLVYESISSYKQRNYERSIEILSDIPEPDLPREARQILGDCVNRQKLSRASNTFQRLKKACDLSQVRQIERESELFWQEIGELHGLDISLRESLNFIIECVRDGIPNDRPTVREESGGVKGEYIVCAGFGWSGSGAVFDFLHQCDDFITVKPSELTMMRHPSFGVEGLFSSTIESIVPRLWRFFGTAIFGIYLEEDSKADQDKFLQKALLSGGCSEVNFVELDKRLLKFLQSVVFCVNKHQNGYIAGDEFIAFLDEFLRARFSFEKEIVLLNNQISGHRGHIIQYMPRVKMVSVYRDPRDQYVSQVVEGNKNINVGKFIDQYLEFQRKCDSTIQQLGSERIRRIRFEEFVLNPGSRTSLLDWLGILDYYHPTTTRFVESDSRQNVGVYKAYRGKREIELIESALRLYLYK